MKEVVLKVDGMSCQGCAAKVKGVLKHLGVEADVKLESGSVDVSYNEEQCTIDQIKAAIEEKGYEVSE